MAVAHAPHFDAPPPPPANTVDAKNPPSLLAAAVVKILAAGVSKHLDTIRRKLSAAALAEQKLKMLMQRFVNMEQLPPAEQYALIAEITRAAVSLAGTPHTGEDPIDGGNLATLRANNPLPALGGVPIAAALLETVSRMPLPDTAKAELYKQIAADFADGTPTQAMQQRTGFMRIFAALPEDAEAFHAALPQSPEPRHELVRRFPGFFSAPVVLSLEGISPEHLTQAAANIEKLLAALLPAERTEHAHALVHIIALLAEKNPWILHALRDHPRQRRQRRTQAEAQQAEAFLLGITEMSQLTTWEALPEAKRLETPRPTIRGIAAVHHLPPSFTPSEHGIEYDIAFAKTLGEHGRHLTAGKLAILRTRQETVAPRFWNTLRDTACASVDDTQAFKAFMEHRNTDTAFTKLLEGFDAAEKQGAYQGSKGELLPTQYILHNAMPTIRTIAARLESRRQAAQAYRLA